MILFIVLEEIVMLLWLMFISWLVFEFHLLRLIIVLTQEKKKLISMLESDVKKEVNTTDILSITENSDKEEEEFVDREWW